jgi:hypothetical protein
VAAAVAALVGTSAIAETRHRDETRGGSGRVERQDRGDNRGGGERSARAEQPSRVEQRSNQNWNRDRGNNNQQQQQRSNENQSRDRGNNQQQRSNGGWNRNEQQSNGNGNREQRSTGNWNRGGGDNRGSSPENWNRSGGRSENYYRDSNRSRSVDNSYYRNRQAPYFVHGRVSRFERWNDGYRVWIGGALYPFFVSDSYWRRSPFRIGVSVRIGGYYNPLGYYDYYDGPYDSSNYGYGSSAPVTSGELRGVVESVDYRRGTLVLRDDISGNFVTTVMRGRDRTFDSLRPGDYIALGGDWVRGGVFEAYRADYLNGGDYRNGDYRR